MRDAEEDLFCLTKEAEDEIRAILIALERAGVKIERVEVDTQLRVDIFLLDG